MQLRIPGLDASLYEDDSGASTWIGEEISWRMKADADARKKLVAKARRAAKKHRIQRTLWDDPS